MPMLDRQYLAVQKLIISNEAHKLVSWIQSRGEEKE